MCFLCGFLQYLFCFCFSTIFLLFGFLIYIYFLKDKIVLCIKWRTIRKMYFYRDIQML